MKELKVLVGKKTIGESSKVMGLVKKGTVFVGRLHRHYRGRVGGFSEGGGYC